MNHPRFSVFFLFINYSFCRQNTNYRVISKRPFRFPEIHFQNEAKCKTFFVKMSFICMKIKKIIFISMALHLALKQRLMATRKWPKLLFYYFFGKKLGYRDQSNVPYIVRFKSLHLIQLCLIQYAPVFHKT